MFPPAALPLLLAPPAAADPPEVFVPGEFRNTAQTTPKGDLVLHPILPSQVGLADFIDLKASPLLWLVGPNLSLEVGLVDTDGFALSLEPGLQGVWNLTAMGSATLRMSARAGQSWVHLGAGVAAIAVTDPTLQGVPPMLGIPVNGGWDLLLSDHQQVRFFVDTDPLSFANGFPVLSAGGTYNHAFGTFRLTVGAGFAYIDALAPNLAALGLDLPPIMPYPQLELAWRFGAREAPPASPE